MFQVLVAALCFESKRRPSFNTQPEHGQKRDNHQVKSCQPTFLRGLGVSLCAKGGISFETGGIDSDESLGVGRVVVEVLPSTLDIHRGKVGMVQGPLGFAAADDAVALVELDLDRSLHVALGVIDCVADEVHLGSEPEAVVAETGELGGNALSDAFNLAVHADALEV